MNDTRTNDVLANSTAPEQYHLKITVDGDGSPILEQTIDCSSYSTGKPGSDPWIYGRSGDQAFCIRDARNQFRDVCRRRKSDFYDIWEVCVRLDGKWVRTLYLNYLDALRLFSEGVPDDLMGFAKLYRSNTFDPTGYADTHAKVLLDKSH